MPEDDDFKASVAVSRKWDGKRVGQEIVDKIKNDEVDPDFILLFSTIHYEGEFEDFLEIINDEFPDAPLVGGTVAGFMSQEGCYTRGVTTLAVDYPNMDVAVGVGHNTKRNPEEAGKKSSEKIRNKLSENNYENKFIFTVVSGPTLPKIAFSRRLKIVESEKLSFLISKLTKWATILNQIGLGRETKVLEGICKNMEEYGLVGISSNDDNNYLKNYQFYNDEIYENSVISLGIQTNLNFTISTTYGLNSTGENAKITESENWNYIIKSLDNKSAVDVFFKKTGISKDVINEENIHRITPFLPLGCTHEDGTLHPYPIASFLGNYLLFGHDAVSNEIEFLSASGDSLVNAVEESINHLPENSEFSLISSCAARLETLGNKAYLVRDKLKKNYGDNFLLLYGLGEERKSPGEEPHLLQESFNNVVFY